jgi:hypothetical protein
MEIIMSILTGTVLQRHEMPKTDLYHEDHPLHHLILDEEEEMHEWYDQEVDREAQYQSAMRMNAEHGC